MENKLLIILPTYNERDNIGPLTQKILKIVPDAHLLIVDDGSADGTQAVALALAQRFPQIHVLRRPKKEGLGKAYIAAFKEAVAYNPEYVIQMDADFSHDPEYIPQFLKKIESCDLVIGSRFLTQNKPVNVSFLSSWANRYARFVLGLTVKDCLGGFKCFRMEALDKIELDKFISKGYIFQTEFIFRAIKKGLRVEEVPILFHPRRFGKTKKSMEIILEAFLGVLTLRFRGPFISKATGSIQPIEHAPL